MIEKRVLANVTAEKGPKTKNPPRTSLILPVNISDKALDWSNYNLHYHCINIFFNFIFLVVATKFLVETNRH